MQKLILILSFILVVFVQEVFAQNAPITTAGNIVSDGSTAVLPISITNFSGIGSCNLKIVYDPTIAIATSVSKESALPGSLASNVSTPGIISLGWYTWPGASLPDNTVIFNISFSKVTGGTSPIIWVDDGYSCAWSNDAFQYLNDIPTSDYYMNGSVSFGKVFQLKTFLEGPFETTEMSQELNPSFIPDNQPYNTLPWEYSGSEIIDSGPPENAVDWILVELRETSGEASTATPVKQIARQAGFILKDGSIVSANGFYMVFDLSISYNLYALIWHRNHLNIMSAIPLVLSGNTYSYDFTTDLGQVYLNGQKNMGGDIFGMFAGDTDGNGEIHLNDIDFQWSDEAGESGYYGGDVNLDSLVNNQDKNDVWFENLNEQSMVPD